MVQNTAYQYDEETQSWYVLDDIYLVFIDDYYDDVYDNDDGVNGGGDEPQHYQHHRHSSDHSIPDI